MSSGPTAGAEALCRLWGEISETLLGVCAGEMPVALEGGVAERAMLSSCLLWWPESVPLLFHWKKKWQKFNTVRMAFFMSFSSSHYT